MNEQEVRGIVLSVLTSIAPEVDGESLLPDRALRRQVDLDSVDWLNFLLTLHEKLDVDIPEADYARLITLNDVVGYLLARVKY